MLTFEERVLCGNPLQRSGSGSDPDPEPNRDFGPVANTSCGMALIYNQSIGSHYRQYRVSILLHLKLRVNTVSTERPQSINRVSTEHQQSVNRASREHQQSVNRASTERQQSVNRASIQHQQSVNRSSTEHQHSINRVSTDHHQSINTASTKCQQSVNRVSTECQQSVNDFGWCILYNSRALLWHIPIINILAAVMCKRDRDMVPAPVWNTASTECQRFCVVHRV